MPAKKNKDENTGKEKIILIGAGGHCKVLIDAIQKSGAFKIAGVVDKNSNIQQTMGIVYLGDDDCLPKIFQSGVKYACVAVGSVGNPQTRVGISRHLEALGFKLPAIVHPSAIIASEAVISDGAFIAAGAIIGPCAKIGKCAIINTGACVDHDCMIGDYVHIAPGVSLSGGVFVGEKSHIGTGACVIGYKRIGYGSIIGAGSVVISDIPPQVKAYGHPCKIVARFDQNQNRGQNNNQARNNFQARPSSQTQAQPVSRPIAPQPAQVSSQPVLVSSQPAPVATQPSVQPFAKKISRQRNKPVTKKKNASSGKKPVKKNVKKRR